MSSPMQSPTPFTRRDADFYAQLARHAGSTDSAKLIYRAQRAYPWLATGRIADAAARIWLVPSLTREGRRYHVALDSGECYYYGPSGARNDCPNRASGKSRCVHFEAALRAEANMFGGSAAEYFAPVIETEVA